MLIYGVMLRVWGERACFTRPEMKVERVSYDVMTPSAARGILEAVHWKPAIRWVVDEIWVMRPIAFSNIRRNEVSSVLSEGSVKTVMKSVASTGTGKPLYQDAQKDRQQRATLMLKDVEYVIKAHFEMTSRAGAADTAEKHYNMFLRRARNGQCYHRPYFGCREFPVSFAPVEEGEIFSPIAEDRDLGWMLYDIDFVKDAVGSVVRMEPRFFRAQMHQGVVRVSETLHREVNV